MKADPTTIFERLKALALEAGPNLPVFVDREGDFVNEPPHKLSLHEFFVAIKIKKTYVSFHLLPVKTDPALLDGVSPALKKRMQGKSCFNFTTVDETLFAELGDLVARSARKVLDR